MDQCKIYLNAALRRKQSEIDTTSCVVDKIIELPPDQTYEFYSNPLADYDFIAENAAQMGVDDDDQFHCILVIGEQENDGILIHSSGANYARYSAYIPNARQILFMEQRYNCIQDLESALMSAVDEVESQAMDYKGDGDFRVLIDELSEKHGFDARYSSLLGEMLEEHSAINEVIVCDDEIIVSVDRQEKEQEQTNSHPSPSPLSFSPDRASQLLDKALDWIGTMESGGELYNTLVERLNMSDEEISAAGFDTLSEYFEDPDEDESFGESAGMKLE
jgi:hypothetical protein